MIRTLVTAAFAVTALAGVASAQNFSLNPAYGTISLSGGFTPDPRVVNLQAGGSISARNVSSSCAGFIADAPDVRLQFSAGSLPLIISTRSSADTTLVINGPDGSWYCDDDSGQGFNASIRFNNPQSGQYDIWVGTFSSGSLQSAGLYISEISSQ
ncbi:peptidase S1 [Hyphomonadaceae bacterium BL14]|nr:peptidase S1 [Hyphomonadaceae bacterium BL14]